MITALSVRILPLLVDGMLAVGFSLVLWLTLWNNCFAEISHLLVILSKASFSNYKSLYDHYRNFREYSKVYINIFRYYYQAEKPSLIVVYLLLVFFFPKKIFFKLIFRERGKGGRKRGRETSIGCLSCAPDRGPVPQPRLVPWLGIEPATFRSIGQHSIHRAPSARTLVFSLVSYTCMCVHTHTHTHTHRRLGL